MHVAQRSNEAVDQQPHARPPRNRKLERPEDAKALGLRIPESRNSSVGSNSTTSRNSARPSGSRAVRKLSNDVKRSSKELKQPRNTDTKATKKPQDPKEERKTQRTVASERLSNFHAKLERGLKSISYRTKTRRKDGSETSKASDRSSKLSPPLDRVDRSSGSPSSCQDKSDKIRADPSSKSMRQLFSMADSWSSDSMISHSDNCACCYNREPCPFHGTDRVEETRTSVEDHGSTDPGTNWRG
ncbi:uncharacterized protein LOC122400828 [Colletes gigas]|uniref:uncharacterized protein LOC122400828 n=1 Tax=Colletes gigas TaxID=935657 RepID=UPI001C9B787E|nr:uncharacterized protein LOC122400828 [Colletes gigas]